jgi:hypothetical protein
MPIFISLSLFGPQFSLEFRMRVFEETENDPTQEFAPPLPVS